MDNLVSLYTTFDGRIGRKTFWLWSIALGVVILILSYIINAVLGNGSVVIDPSATPEAISAAMNGVLQKSAWVSLVLAIIFAYPSLALMTKLRHDKDNNGLDVIVFYGIELLLLVLQGLGLVLNVVGMVLGVVLLVYGIYLLVVLGFLKGTTGPNTYGPDPLTAGAVAAA